SIALGTAQQFDAVGLYTDGSRRTVTAQAAWSSSNGSVAAVGAQPGLARGAGQGSARIAASLGGFTASANLSVSSATVSSIQRSPLRPAASPRAPPPASAPTGSSPTAACRT